MSTIIVKDGTERFYNDWGVGQPIVFHHGWLLSGDGWDTQIMYFAERGYRVIEQTYPGYLHGMATTYADVINPDLLAFIRS